MFRILVKTFFVIIFILGAVQDQNLRTSERVLVASKQGSCCNQDTTVDGNQSEKLVVAQDETVECSVRSCTEKGDD